MTNEEIIAHQRREREFAATELGKAFIRFERTAADAWVKDTQSTGSYKSLEATWARHKQARDELVALLRPLVGLEP